LVFAMPVRTRKREAGRWVGHGDGGPMDRTTVSRDWHKAALHDAALRDMPLHALRHTAAAAWLAAGNSLMYVQRQLGHSEIGTTERYYGHLERHVLAAGAIATEEAIERASLAAHWEATGGSARAATVSPCSDPGSDDDHLASSSHLSMSSGTNRTGPSGPPILTDGIRPAFAAS
jgi:hypothetical protein